MIDRDVSDFIEQNATWFPVVSVVGPRQSGKSTLVKALFPDYAYVNLEDEADFNLAAASASDFIKERSDRMIIDEAQRLPALFDAVQVASDSRGSTGQYVLSGSQNFLIAKGISQSLAGRVGTIPLFPLSYKEAHRSDSQISPDSFMLSGGYPRVHAASIPGSVFYRNYVDTYVQRDIAGYVEARNLSTFRKLLQLCAQCAGSLVNISRLAADAGIARPTVESWMSLLESSYIVFRLQPYFANLRKRLTKTPKLYFYDTGLLCYLLGIQSSEQLRDSPFRGAIFENLIVEETMKRHINAGREPRLFFYRDDRKVEVDLVDSTDSQNIELVEVKSTMSFQASYLKNLGVVGESLGVPEKNRFVVMRSDASTSVGAAKVWSAHDWLLR